MEPGKELYSKWEEELEELYGTTLRGIGDL